MPELKSNGHTSSTMAPSHLVVLFLTTGGQNAENLGSDEEQIVSFVYQLFDVSNNKVCKVFSHSVYALKCGEISSSVSYTIVYYIEIVYHPQIYTP